MTLDDLIRKYIREMDGGDDHFIILEEAIREAHNNALELALEAVGEDEVEIEAKFNYGNHMSTGHNYNRAKQEVKDKLNQLKIWPTGYSPSHPPLTCLILLVIIYYVIYRPILWTPCALPKPSTATTCI